LGITAGYHITEGSSLGRPGQAQKPDRRALKRSAASIQLLTNDGGSSRITTFRSATAFPSGEGVLGPTTSMTRARSIFWAVGGVKFGRKFDIYGEFWRRIPGAAHRLVGDPDRVPGLVFKSDFLGTIASATT
jgi:hypothetical protein